MAVTWTPRADTSLRGAQMSVQGASVSQDRAGVTGSPLCKNDKFDCSREQCSRRKLSPAEVTEHLMAVAAPASSMSRSTVPHRSHHIQETQSGGSRFVNLHCEYLGSVGTVPGPALCALIRSLRGQCAGWWPLGFQCTPVAEKTTQPF